MESNKSSNKNVFKGQWIGFTGDFGEFNKQELASICEKLGGKTTLKSKPLPKKVKFLFQGCQRLYTRNGQSDDINDSQSSILARQRRVKIIPYDQIDEFFIRQAEVSIFDLLNKLRKQHEQRHSQDVYTHKQNNFQISPTVHHPPQVSSGNNIHINQLIDHDRKHMIQESVIQNLEEYSDIEDNKNQGEDMQEDYSSILDVPLQRKVSYQERVERICELEEELIKLQAENKFLKERNMDTHNQNGTIKKNEFQNSMNQQTNVSQGLNFEYYYLSRLHSWKLEQIEKLGSIMQTKCQQTNNQLIKKSLQCRKHSNYLNSNIKYQSGLKKNQLKTKSSCNVYLDILRMGKKHSVICQKISDEYKRNSPKRHFSDNAHLLDHSNQSVADNFLDFNWAKFQILNFQSSSVNNDKWRKLFSNAKIDFLNVQQINLGNNLITQVTRQQLEKLPVSVKILNLRKNPLSTNSLQVIQKFSNQHSNRIIILTK